MKIIGVIATKNRLDLLKLAVDSAINQTEKLDQLIVVSDSQENVFKEEQNLLKDKDVILLKDIYTHNYAGNLNTAVEYVIGTNKNYDDIYIAFLDDDDKWDKTYIQKCKSKAQGVDFVIAGLQNKRDHELEKLNINPNLTVDDFLRGNPGIQGSNTFVRLSTLLKAGLFDERLSSTTDRDLFVRIMKHKPVYRTINEYLVDCDASDGRARITNSPDIKKQGLATFHYKYKNMMSKEIEEAFFTRALKLFNMSKDEFELREIEIEKNEFKQNKNLLTETHYTPLIIYDWKDLEGIKAIVPSKKKVDDWRKEYLPKCKSEDEMFSFILDSDVGITLNSFLLIRLATLSICKELADPLITRVECSNLYKNNMIHLFAKFVKFNYLEKTNVDNEKIQNVVFDESIIRGIIDYLRHMLNAANTMIEFNKNKQLILSTIGERKYKTLGNGNEGYVFTSNGYIYKWFKTFNEDDLNHLRYLEKSLKNVEHTYHFEIINKNNLLLLRYPFVKAKDAKHVKESEVIELIEDFKRNNLCISNIKNRNFVRDENGLKYIDFGESIRPYDKTTYQRSLLRAKQTEENNGKNAFSYYIDINRSYLKGDKK